MVGAGCSRVAATVLISSINQGSPDELFFILNYIFSKTWNHWTSTDGWYQLTGFEIVPHVVPDCEDMLLSTYPGDVDIQDGQVGYFHKVIFSAPMSFV